jgi:hypothetical protein
MCTSKITRVVAMDARGRIFWDSLPHALIPQSRRHHTVVMRVTSIRMQMDLTSFVRHDRMSSTDVLNG